MSGTRQVSVWVALGLWAAVVIGAAVYGTWHGYGGRSFALTLVVLAFLLASQLLLASGNLGARLVRRAGSHSGALLAVVPLLAYLIYMFGTNAFTWRHVAIAAAYTLTPVLLAIFRVESKTGAWTDYLACWQFSFP